MSKGLQIHPNSLVQSQIWWSKHKGFQKRQDKVKGKKIGVHDLLFSLESLGITDWTREMERGLKLWATERDNLIWDKGVSRDWVQWLRAHSAPAEDWCSVPSTFSVASSWPVTKARIRCFMSTTATSSLPTHIIKSYTSEVINLKESEEGCVGVSVERKGKKNDAIML